MITIEELVEIRTALENCNEPEIEISLSETICYNVKRSSLLFIVSQYENLAPNLPGRMMRDTSYRKDCTVARTHETPAVSQ